MAWKMNPNAVNQVSKDSIIFSEGESVFSIAMVIKGRVQIANNGSKVIIGSGAFLGINDLYTGKYQSTYTAYDDLMIYVFPINQIDELENILSSNKDYHGFMVATYYKMINELNQIYHSLLHHGSKLYQFLTTTYKDYLEMAYRRGYKARTSDRIQNLSAIEGDLELLSDRIDYYCECNKLPIDAVKMFYSYGNAVTMYQVEDQVAILNQQIEAVKEMGSQFIALAECLVDDSDSCMFRLIGELSMEMKDSSNSDLLDVMDNIIEEVNKAESFSEQSLGTIFNVNRKRMEEVYHLLLTGNSGKEVSTETLMKYSKEDTQLALAELKDSFEKILEYAGINGTKAEEMKATMQDYVHLKDVDSTDESCRALRRKMAQNHYELYKYVFIRAHKEKKAPRLMDLFLKYGFADERLLTTEQLISLYYLPEEEQKQQDCKVYDIKAWLTLIYEGKREPSKNEFDMEYPEMLMGLKKQGKLTEEELRQYLKNPEKRLEYEIQNMFRYNNRTTNGQISIFVPVLHKEQWSNSIERMLLNSTKVNEVVDKLMKIDYSVFDRELIYTNSEKKIVKEYIIKRVYPDIILMPTVGTNGVMWQEISGKRRDSAGRFLLPIFTEVSLNTLMVKMLGRYRWELCRTVEGTAWNDIKLKSLTSEYCDYLQFYRKNKELSEEKKEKIKLQIQKGRNNSREVFVIDYEQWINYEAVGAIKLNKPIREIMATYCPFSKEIRERIKLQPLFEEAMARFYRDKQKKVREVEGRHRLLQKDQIELPTELVETLIYHRDL